MRSERYELGQLIIGTADFLCYSLKVDPTGRSQVDAFVWNENRSGEPAGTRTRGHLIKRKLPLQKNAEFTDGWLFVVGSLVGTPCDDFVLLLFLTIK